MTTPNPVLSDMVSVEKIDGSYIEYNKSLFPFLTPREYRKTLVDTISPILVNVVPSTPNPNFSFYFSEPPVTDKVEICSPSSSETQNLDQNMEVAEGCKGGVSTSCPR